MIVFHRTHSNQSSTFHLSLSSNVVSNCNYFCIFSFLELDTTMSFWGNFNETFGGPVHHAHFNPWIYQGLPITQVGHHRGAQVVGGFSATDPW